MHFQLQWGETHGKRKSHSKKRNFEVTLPVDPTQSESDIMLEKTCRKDK